jgi:hypothetical protein
MQSRIKSATRLLMGLAVVAAAACGGESGSGSTGPSDPGTPPPSGGEVSGSYALTQIRTLGHLGGGGPGLPADFVDGSGSHLVFKSGTLILGADQSFDMKVQVSLNGSEGELTDYGTYSVSGGSVTFSSQKSNPRLSTGTISGNKLTAKSQFAGIPFEIDVVR